MKLTSTSFYPPLQVQVKSTSPASLKSVMRIALSISSTLACSLSWTRRPVNNRHCRFRYPLGRFSLFSIPLLFFFSIIFSFLFLEKSWRASTSRDFEKGAGGTEHYAFHYSMHGRGVVSNLFSFFFFFFSFFISFFGFRGYRQEGRGSLFQDSRDVLLSAAYNVHVWVPERACKDIHTLGGFC